MHYIIGTRLKVIPAQRVDPKNFFRGEKNFKSGATYSLINIKRTESGVTYNFACREGPVVEMQFESCRQGDKFIAKHRQEELPDYDNIEKSD
jgi:hypothetical protein